MHLQIQRTFFQTKKKLNVINKVWKWMIFPKISASLSLFDAMKHKNENVEWECWLRMEGFLKGFGVKKKYGFLIMQWLFYQNHVSLFRRCISVNTWYAKMTNISKSHPKPPKMHLRNIHWTVGISIYLLKIPGEAWTFALSIWKHVDCRNMFSHACPLYLKWLLELLVPQ